MANKHKKSMISLRDREKNRLYLANLKSILEAHNIPSIYYSIGDYSEDAVCIECLGNKVIVYSGMRGMQFNAEDFYDIQAACNKVLEKLSDNSIQLQAMKSELELMNTQTDISICLKKPIAESARAKQSTRTKQYLNKSIKHVEKKSS